MSSERRRWLSNAFVDRSFASMDPRMRAGRDWLGAIRRRGAFLLAAGFLIAVVGDVYDAHDCPHHDHFVQVQGEAHDHDASPAGPCMCVGDCHGTAASPLTPPDASTVLLAAAGRAAAETPHGEATPDRALPFLIPFSTGPPSAPGPISSR